MFSISHRMIVGTGTAPPARRLFATLPVVVEVPGAANSSDRKDGVAIARAALDWVATLASSSDDNAAAPRKKHISGLAHGHEARRKHTHKLGRYNSIPTTVLRP